MKVTIVTLYRGETADTYVGAIRGSVSAKDRARVSRGLKVRKSCDEDEIGFQEVELADEPGELAEVLQAFP